MPIMFNDLMHLTSEEIENSKVEFNKTDGAGGELFIERWYRHNDEEKSAGTCFDCSYWKKEKPGQIVFSFIWVAEDTWLFVSAARIIEVKDGEPVKVEIISECNKYFGRLLVHCKKRFPRSYLFWLHTYIYDMEVIEIVDSTEYLGRYIDENGVYYDV